MSKVRLSEINNENLNDDEIDNIVYSNIKDDNLSSEYAIVFGNSKLIKERVTTSVNAYKNGRIKKIIYTGGTNGVSNSDNSLIPEAVKMKELAVTLGVSEEDIIIEEKANNTFENINNSMKLIPGDTKHIIIITSEFHLKRCMAIIKKNYPNISITMIPSYDGETDRDNWFSSDNSKDTGRSIVTYEANLLINYSKEKMIYDLEIEKNDMLSKS